MYRRFGCTVADVVGTNFHCRWRHRISAAAAWGVCDIHRQPSHYLKTSQRSIFDTKEYYDRVFGDLGDGEVLEWYNADWDDLAPSVAPLIQRWLGTAKPLPQAAVVSNVSLCPHRSKSRLFDIGCGTSRLPAQLASEIAHLRTVVGVDISPEAVRVQRTLRAAKSRTLLTHPASRLHFVEADVAVSLPFRNAAFGIVMEKGFIDALFSTKRGKSRIAPVLSEAWRVLAPGGMLLSLSQSTQCRLPLFRGHGFVPSPYAIEVHDAPSVKLWCYAMYKPEHV